MTSHNCVLHCYHKLLQERAARQDEGQPQASPPQQQVPPQRNRQVDHQSARGPIAPPTRDQVDPPIAQRQQEASHQNQQQSGCEPRNPHPVSAPQQHVAPTAPPATIAPREGEAPQQRARPSVMVSPPAERVGPSNAQQVAPVPSRQGEPSQQQAKPRVVGQQQARSNVQVSPTIQEEASHSRAKKTDIVSPPGPSQQKKSQPHVKSEPMRSEVESTHSIRMVEVAQKRNGQRQEKGPPKKLTRNGIPVVFEESRKDTMIGLWEHIARKIKRGVYDLQPVKKGQCPTCRRRMSCGLAPHQAICRPEMYTLGCPCGYLCSTIGSLNSHHATCDFYLENFNIINIQD
ncbi:developmental and secondary metabolism regulator VEL1-like isoform X2 [Drosophila subpulchrella]|uniref:developmental and secondary metabolism regulator VEL1-like isoform X2 n=1 Tax=Drosophila subpulchrella TaxID=1486046 RepID=UPI0018A1A3CF|nr:developmental and secondary metabolism regulator VEL1-like isoform X2 [Drosophila subpulchrella]